MKKLYKVRVIFSYNLDTNRTRTRSGFLGLGNLRDEVVSSNSEVVSETFQEFPKLLTQIAKLR